MTDKKVPKLTDKKSTKAIKRQSGAMTFVINKKGEKVPNSISDKIYETKGTGPKNQLIEKDE